MAHIDHEGGNQSGLIESFSLYNHFLIFEKKKQPHLLICLHTTIMSLLRVKDERGQRRTASDGRDLSKQSLSLF